MPKDTKTLGNNKARACESLGFVHKKRLCQRFDTTSSLYSKGGDITTTTSIVGTFILIHADIRPTFQGPMLSGKRKKRHPCLTRTYLTLATLNLCVHIYPF